MKIVGFTNVITRNGNKGVKVCVSGNWSKWDKENGDPRGQKCELWYVSRVHLREEDIGKKVVLYFGKYNGSVYVQRMDIEGIHF